MRKERFIGKKPSDTTFMRCTIGLQQYLFRKRIDDESYEDTIWRMIAYKKLTGEDKKEIKKAGYEDLI